MPYKKAYNQKNVGTGASRTPSKVMGSQGSAISIKPMYNKTKATKRSKFPSK